MKLQERTSGEVLVVKIEEKSFDAHVATQFRDRMAELIDGGQRRVVIDLSSVEMLDSTGLGALIWALKRVGGQGALALCGLSGPVLNVLRLTRMDRVFRILPDEAEAVERVTTAQPAGAAK